jgi:hypothetical protein
MTHPSTDHTGPASSPRSPLERRIIEQLGRLPDEEVPPEIYRGIMSRLTPKRPRLWHQMRFRLTRPVTVRFVPWRWVPALAAAILVLVVYRAPLPPGRPTPGEPLAPEMAALTLTYDHPAARHVALIGSFSNWDPASPVIRAERRGTRWIFHLEVRPGRYEYAFLVDGREVVPDPRAVFSRRDGFGTVNSIVYANPGDHARL